MQKVENVPPDNAAKGGCYVCSYDTSGRDFCVLGPSIDFEGMLVLCENCVTEAADTMGVFQALKKEKHDRDQFRAELDELRDVVRELTRVMAAAEPVVQRATAIAEQFAPRVRAAARANPNDG